MLVRALARAASTLRAEGGRARMSVDEAAPRKPRGTHARMSQPGSSEVISQQPPNKLTTDERAKGEEQCRPGYLRAIETVLSLPGGAFQGLRSTSKSFLASERPRKGANGGYNRQPGPSGACSAPLHNGYPGAL